MNASKTLVATLTGTSAMTAFSYATSANQHQQFREPEILASCLRRLIPGLSKNTAHINGWLLHYFAGLLFCTGYNKIWKARKPTLLYGASLGFISGIIGAGVWNMVLSLHPNPPRIPQTKYLPHLLPAHLVFGIFAAMGYNTALKLNATRINGNTSPDTQDGAS
jgi:hypothetical protein